MEKVNSIKIDELTISLVSESYPRKMICHLREERGFAVIQKERGIYEVIGDRIPIQIIVTSQLSRQVNLWLNSLTKRLSGVEAARELLDESADHKDSNLYNSVMDIIIKANQEKFKEARVMSGALLELFRDELEEQKMLAEKTGRENGEKLGKEIGEKLGKEIGEKLGKEIGKEIGESRVNNLNRRLAAQGRTEDIIKAASDTEYQRLLFQEFNL